MAYRERKRFALSCTAVVVALALLAACGKKPDATASSGAARAKIIYGDQRNLRPMAEVAKAFDGTDYDFGWATFATPSVIFEAFRSGAIDMASSNDITILNAAATGVKLKIVGAIRGNFLQQSVGIIVQGNSPIHSVAELKGHKIIVSSARGGSGDNLLQGAIREAGLKPSDISVSYAPFNDSLSAFRANEIDALVTNDPYLILAEQHGGRVLRNGEGINAGLGLIVASEAALADPARRAAIADVLGRLANATHWCAEHPDDYAKFFSQQIGVDYELMRQVVRRGGGIVEPVNDEVIRLSQKVADDLVERGFWERPLQVAPFFDPIAFHTPTPP